MNSCLILALDADGRNIVTIEGISDTDQLSVVQEKFIEYGTIQCGYCTSGMIMSATALLKENPKPTAEEVRKGIAGNLCRCTGYINIIKAIMAASGQDIPN